MKTRAINSGDSWGKVFPITLGLKALWCFRVFCSCLERLRKMSKNLGEQKPDPSVRPSQHRPAGPCSGAVTLWSASYHAEKVSGTLQLPFSQPLEKEENLRALAASHYTQDSPERMKWTCAHKTPGFLSTSCTQIIKPTINLHLLGLGLKSQSQIAIDASPSTTQCHGITK